MAAPVTQLGPVPDASAESPAYAHDEDEGFEDIAEDLHARASLGISGLFTNPPPITDAHWSHTLEVQNETMHECLPLLAGTQDNVELTRHGVPRLRREAHIRFLHKQLGTLPPQFVVADASRPWFLFWCLNGLSLLGEDVSSYRRQLADTARSMQNPDGGFGGGPGQQSHLATTFAVILSIAVVGGEEAYEVIDRKAMWKWLNTLKQPDGSVTMAYGGEADVRAAYCTAVTIGLLNMPIELSPDSPAYTPDGKSTFYTGLGDYIRRCQTYEGGISGRPDAEAHGAYAFCALACLSILDYPHRSIPKYLDVPRLIAWLASRQNAPEAGFSGRTNKLVDGCYAHWVGGCWPLIDTALNGGNDLEESPSPTAEVEWYNREGLIRYILSCAQDQTKRGGLRDKPSRPSDAYHSCYVLSGLTSAQHKWELKYVDENDTILADPVWKVSPRTGEEEIFEEEDRISTMHPAYTIPEQKAYDTKAYYASKPGF
ncbi:prenyltransferase and squalene oxidase [Plectosphaerella plurivora]|uniref:Protein farnesyltransferase subunit beta n=1 Tax=Plectosphaerella plurivora TaxID=936078 RepID=A0A9P9A9I1_9PEZI|nr:prenyltransferase and squalene oxidase [Plectosphaerella plurivora]